MEVSAEAFVPAPRATTSIRINNLTAVAEHENEKSDLLLRRRWERAATNGGFDNDPV